MKLTVPTITETREAVIIRIPKAWVGSRARRPLTEAAVVRMVAVGERAFRQGKTQEFGAFLAKRYPAHVRIFRRAR